MVAANLVDLVRDLWGKGFSISRWYIPGHDGIDLPAKKGTPVRAVASGYVEFADDARKLSRAEAGRAWAIGGGNVVNVTVGQGLATQYAHLDTITVRKGQYVRKGEVIGTVGATGGILKNGQQGGPGSEFFGPHLHFGLWDKKRGRMINPTSFLLAARAGWNTGAGKDDQYVPPAPSLGAWGDLIKFPEGHVITPADVETMMAALERGGFFADDPAGIAKSQTRTILTSAIGEKWDKSLQDRLQAQFANAAAASNPLAAVGNLAAEILDPGNWIRIIALFAGIGIAAYGTINVLRASADSPAYR